MANLERHRIFGPLISPNHRPGQCSLLAAFSADLATSYGGGRAVRRIARASYCCLLLGRLGETKPTSKGHSKEMYVNVASPLVLCLRRVVVPLHVASVLLHDLVAPATVFRSDGTPA